MTPDQIAQYYQIRRLGKGESVFSFNCGDEDLNDFILNESIQYRQTRLAVTYVIEVKNTNNTIGFFSLANDRISISDFENKTEFNRFRKKRFVNEKKDLKAIRRLKYAVSALIYQQKDNLWALLYLILSSHIS